LFKKVRHLLYSAKSRANAGMYFLLIGYALRFHVALCKIQAWALGFARLQQLPSFLAHNLQAYLYIQVVMNYFCAMLTCDIDCQQG
jgi:hypothetical protein